MVAVIPAGNTTAEAAAKKPGAVTKITKVKATQNTLKVKWNKVKNKTGYQVRAYAGKKLVKSAKTKKTAYTVKGLKPATKYTIKVRAYGKKNGKTIYGKEKKITYKTAKTPAKTPAPAPVNDTEEDKIVLPGQSTSTGAALVAEYNAWIAYLAKPQTGKTKDARWAGSGDGRGMDVQFGHFGGGYTYVAGCTNSKYEAFKTGQTNLDTMNEILADWFIAIGLKGVEIRDASKKGYSTEIWADLDDGKLLIAHYHTNTEYAASKNGLVLNINASSTQTRAEYEELCERCERDQQTLQMTEKLKEILERMGGGYEVNDNDEYVLLCTREDVEAWEAEIEALKAEFPKADAERVMEDRYVQYRLDTLHELLEKAEAAVISQGLETE